MLEPRRSRRSSRLPSFDPASSSRVHRSSSLACLGPPEPVPCFPGLPRLGAWPRRACSYFLYIIKGRASAPWRLPTRRRPGPASGTPASAAGSASGERLMEDGDRGPSGSQVGAGAPGQRQRDSGERCVSRTYVRLSHARLRLRSRRGRMNGVRVPWVDAVAVGGITAGAGRATCRRKRRLRQGGESVPGRYEGCFGT